MPEPTCLNLLRLYGGRYKITYDPAYDAKGVPRRCLDPWYMQIPCAGKGVTIYPHGGARLAVEIDYRWSVARKVAAIPGVQLHQDGDGEKTYLFDVALFDRVAAVVKPRRRRVLTAEQREALVGRSEGHRFQKRPG
jgi:hypothetical protein